MQKIKSMHPDQSENIISRMDYSSRRFFLNRCLCFQVQKDDENDSSSQVETLCTDTSCNTK